MVSIGEHLRIELNARRTRNPAYSLRSFAKWLGLSPAQLSQMISGKRTVTPKILHKISDRLGLSPTERLQFLGASIDGFQAINDDLHLEEDQFRLVSEWYNLAILSLTKTPGAKADVRWISKRLGITVTQAQESLARLQRLGLIELQPFRQTSKPIRVSSKVKSDAIRAYHKQNLNIAIEKIETVDTSKRELQAITMPADPRKLEAARQVIDEFLTRMADLMESGSPSEVYTFSVQLFPVSQEGSK